MNNDDMYGWKSFEDLQLHLSRIVTEQIEFWESEIGAQQLYNPDLLRGYIDRFSEFLEDDSLSRTELALAVAMRTGAMLYYSFVYADSKDLDEDARNEIVDTIRATLASIVLTLTSYERSTG
jgi:hypothetical protein